MELSGDSKLVRGAFIAVVLSLAGTANAVEPELKEVFPMSCHIGDAVDVQTNGQGLGEDSVLLFSKPGVTSTSIGEGKFRIESSENCVPGDCDVWMMTEGRLTNPVRFVLADIPSLVETEPNDTQQTAQEIPLPGSVDCHVDNKAEFDWFRFSGAAGQTVTVLCRSRTLGGSVEPILSVYGPSGTELAHAAGHQREPAVTLTLQESGPHFVRVIERAYRKTDGAIYRLTLEAGPRVLSTFPNLVAARSESLVTLYGFALPASEPVETADSTVQLSKTLTPSRLRAIRVPLNVSSLQDASRDVGVWRSTANVFPNSVSYRHPGAAGAAMIHVSDRPVIVEDETLEGAQHLEIPVLMNGRFLKHGEVDRFTFEGTKGDSLRFDVYGDRLGLRMDVDAAILDSQGKTVVTFPDVSAPKGVPAIIVPTSLDVSATWKVPADGTYQLVLRDLYGGSLAGVDRTYALHLRRAQPGFRVLALPPEESTPSGVTIPAGGCGAWQLIAVRNDGFDGSIRVRLDESSMEDLTGNWWIGPEQTSTLVAIEADSKAMRGPRPIRVIAQADVDGDSMKVPVEGATISRSGARLTDQCVVGIGEPARFRIDLSMESSSGAPSSELKLLARRSNLDGPWTEPINIDFPSLPPGWEKPEVAMAAGDDEAEIALTIPQDANPGRYSVTALASTTLIPNSNDQKKKPVDIRIWTNSVTVEVVK